MPINRDNFPITHRDTDDTSRFRIEFTWQVLTNDVVICYLPLLNIETTIRVLQSGDHLVYINGTAYHYYDNETIEEIITKVEDLIGYLMITFLNNWTNLRQRIRSEGEEALDVYEEGV